MTTTDDVGDLRAEVADLRQTVESLTRWQAQATPILGESLRLLAVVSEAVVVGPSLQPSLQLIHPDDDDE